MKRLIAAIILIIAISPSALSDSPFGVVCPWSGTKDAGIKWIRCGAGCTALDWGAIEKERGVFDWKAADAEVRGIIAEGASPLPILGYSPKWASTGADSSYPPNLSDWSDFVYRIVSRYKGKIKYWEVWNEPDIGFWKGTIDQYSDLLKSAYVAAKKADPNCKIVFGGTAGVNLPFTEMVYQNGGKYYFDVMAAHPYQWGDTFDDQSFISQLTDLHDLMEKWGDGHKEIWLTELGWSTGDKAITEEVQARLLAQALITSQCIPETNVTKVFWFCIKDWGGPGYGLLRPDGSRKPAFQAYKAVTSALEGAEFVKWTRKGDTRNAFFRKEGKGILATWSPGKMPVVRQADIPMPKPRKKPVIPTAKYKLDVWMSVSSPEGTSRPFAIRGRDNEVSVIVHNDSPTKAFLNVNVQFGITGVGAGDPIAPGQTMCYDMPLILPKGLKKGLEMAEISAQFGGKSLAPIAIPIRIADGPVTEFLANSTIESRYLVENEGSGTSPSVRFNGTWTYKFDLSNVVGGTLDLCVGANQGNEWRVLLSSDQKTWKTGLEGKSVRSWHEVDVSAYAGGPLFVKFEGNDEQLSNLILMRKL